MRILLVEDNRSLSTWLARTLGRERYVVECAYDGEDANRRLASEAYDGVILDLTLPRMTGDEVLRRLRGRDDNLPVLVLTAHDTMKDRVGSLDAGADDFMAKPFEMAELEARMRALLRRGAHSKNPVLRCGNLAYDSNTRLFTVAERPLALTPREHAVLEALVLKVGRTVSKQALAESLYSIEDQASPDAIEVYVHRLRRKMEGCSAQLVTLRGLGYLLRHAEI